MGENTITAAAIAGFVAPPLIAIINRKRWSSEVKGIVAFLVCVAIALATAWYEERVDWHNLRTVLPVVFGSAILTYHQFWKPSGIAPAIEGATG